MISSPVFLSMLCSLTGFFFPPPRSNNSGYVSLRAAGIKLSVIRPYRNRTLLVDTTLTFFPSLTFNLFLQVVKIPRTPVHTDVLDVTRALFVSSKVTSDGGAEQMAAQAGEARRPSVCSSVIKID